MSVLSEEKNMSLDLTQAIAQLANVTNADQLRDLITQINISTNGSITVLYSGRLPDGTTGAGDVAQGLATHSNDVRLLDNTASGKFLATAFDKTSLLFDKLQTLVGGDATTPGTLANQFLFGEKAADGSRIPNGAWDVASRRFAENATGDVRTIIGFTNNPESVFVRTELPALLKNPAVTHIEGIPIAEVEEVFLKNGGNLVSPQELGNLAAQQSVLKRVQYASELNMAMTGMLDGASSTTKTDFLNKVSNVEDYLAKNPKRN
jgi:hypothetical protein